MALVSTDAGHKSHAAGVVLMIWVIKTLSRGQTIERFVLLSQPSLSPFIKKYVPITNTIGRLAPRLESAMRGVSILFVVLALCSKKQRAKISMRGMEFSNLGLRAFPARQHRIRDIL